LNTHPAPNSLVFLLIPMVLFSALAMDIYVPAVPALPALLKTNADLVQLTLSCFIFGIGVGQVIAGPLSDSFGRRCVGLMSLSIFVLASWGCALSQNIAQLIIARLVEALGACGCTVVALAMVRDAFPEKNQPKIYSYLAGSISVAPILGPIIGGYLLLWFTNWRVMFLFLGLFGFIMLLLQYIYLP